jgi:hypothetical protein
MNEECGRKREVFFQRLPGETEENHKNLSRAEGLTVEIWNWNLLNTEQECYQCYKIIKTYSIDIYNEGMKWR